MAECPHCGRHLRLTDWKPVCPGCGVNLNYYDANDILLEESEKAEIEHARFQPKVDRAKAAYAGNIRHVLRIVFTLLPVGALFLPLFVNDGANVNAIGLYKLVSGADFGSLLSDISAAGPLVCLLLSAALILVDLIFLIASLGKHGKGRTIFLYVLTASLACAAVVWFLVSGGKVCAGGYLYAVLQVWSCVWNYLLMRRGIEVRYTPCIIGGLPSETYFYYVSRGLTREQIRREMLIALTEQHISAKRVEAERKEAGENV